MTSACTASRRSSREHQRWDFKATDAEHYPLLLHYPYFDLYRKQVVKQADLVLAMHWRGDAFTADQKLRNFDYYEALTVRDSSLSACTQAVIAAEVGHLELAYDYFGEAALIDLDDLEQNASDGLHIASLAGAWIAAVAGFGGMREFDGELKFMPRLPPELTRLAFGLSFRGRQLQGRGRALTRHLLAARGAAARPGPSRRGDHGRRGQAGAATDPSPAPSPRSAPAGRPRTGPPPATALRLGR